MSFPMFKKIQDLFQRKQLRKSLETFQKLVESNPKDTRIRLKLGDLYAKTGYVAEAVEQYIASAEIFAEAGFQLKSIALYRQILKLDSGSLQSHRRLAQLTFQHGLLADSHQCYVNLSDCLRKNKAGLEQVEVFEGILKLRLQSLKSGLAMAELIFSEHMEGKDLYQFMCSRLPELTPDRIAIEDVQSVLHWLSNRYPSRWEAQELLAQILYKQGKKELVQVAVDNLETLFKKLGMHEEKKGLLNKYREIKVTPKVKSELLGESIQSDKGYRDDQVKIKLETNIYNILKKKAEGTGISEVDKSVEDKKERGSETIGFADLFQNFKQDLQAKIPEGDYETHFNLGIAYREMSLHEDALREFRIALENPSLRYDCYYFMGQSLMELDKPDEAIATYRKGMAIEGLTNDKLLGLKYELALALVETGKKKDALNYFREISQLQSDYRDVAERIEALKKSTIS